MGSGGVEDGCGWQDDGDVVSGLSSQVLAKLDTATNKPTEAYTFDAYGQRLTQTSTKTDGTSEDAWYGYSGSSQLRV